MAMLMMPDRSQTRPDIAPKISGTDRARAPASSEVTGMTEVRPAPTQTRKARTNAIPTTTCSHADRFWRCRVRSTAYPVAATSTTASSQTAGDEGTLQFGMVNQLAPEANWKVVSVPPSVPRAKTSRVTRAARPYMIADL
jgi:hypothetical protein